MPRYRVPQPESLLPGIVRGLITTVLAFALAGFSLFRRRGPLNALDFSGGLAPLLRPLRRIHSGHMGDYVAWLTFGTALFAGIFALLVR